MASKSLLAFLLLSIIIFSGCGSTIGEPVAQAQSNSGALTCRAPAVFRGADDGQQNAFAVYTVCGAANVPSGGGNYLAEVTYTLQHPFTASHVTTWLGTAQGSVEETAGELVIEVPTAVSGSYRTMAIITNQKDKHQDVDGERIEHFSNGTYNLPAGTRLHFFMNLGIINTAANCPHSCGMQLNVYLNGLSQ